MYMTSNTNKSLNSSNLCNFSNICTEMSFVKVFLPHFKILTESLSTQTVSEISIHVNVANTFFRGISKIKIACGCKEIILLNY